MSTDRLSSTIGSLWSRGLYIVVILDAVLRITDPTTDRGVLTKLLLTTEVRNLPARWIALIRRGNTKAAQGLGSMVHTQCRHPRL